MGRSADGQGFGEAQTARGLAPHAEWRRKNKHAFKTAEECVADRAYGGDSSDSDEDDPEDQYRDPQPPFSPDKSEGMTKSQLEPYCNAFTAGFYGFTNHDRIHSGTGSGGGVKKVGDAAAADIRRRGIRGAGGEVPPEDMTFLSMEVSEDILVKQMRELCGRYRVGGVPLRPAVLDASAASGSGVPKGKGAGAARRAAKRNNSKTHTAALVRCVLATMTPTEGSARVTANAMHLLSDAAGRAGTHFALRSLVVEFARLRENQSNTFVTL